MAVRKGTSTISVSENVILTSVGVSATTTIGADDISFWLQSLSGTVIQVHTANYLTRQNSDFTANGLTGFNGQNSTGMWTLLFCDGLRSFAGSVNTWSLGINGNAANTFTVFAVTVWGVNSSGVVWQFVDSSGKWWWFVQGNNGAKIVIPIEHRDRKNDQGSVITNYPLSRLTVQVGSAPYDLTKYNAYDAVTLQPLHQVWIQVGPEGSPDSKSVFVP